MFKNISIYGTQLVYRSLRPLIFLTDCEWVHGHMTGVGESIGRHPILNGLFGDLFRVKNRALKQTVHGIHFQNPIGLSAGFDYEARLMHVLPSIGFGFGTVGTISNQPYEGNPRPMLGRLPRSRSLMVNKGFKNHGIRQVVEKLSHEYFSIPIGISLGKTNSRQAMNQEEAVADVVSAFTVAENSSAPFAYYELNISCPNLFGSIEFYSREHLAELLRAVTDLRLKKPLFIKMPIDKSDGEVIQMLDVILQYPVQGVIFGNLQKNRQDPALDQEEVMCWPVGNFSGKPTQRRSGELIRLAFRHAGKRLTIVGCGGTFGAEDAYRKIRLGASLVQLITGLIFVGPQLPGQINLELLGLLKRDGFKHISEAIGVDA